MPTLEHVLSRLSYSELLQEINKETKNLIKHLSISKISSITLAKLIIKKRGEQETILNNGLRKKIIEALKEKEAEHLSRLLSVNSDTPWKSVIQLPIKKQSIQFEILCIYFKINIYKEPEKTITSNIKITPDYPLFPYQKQAKQKVHQLLNSNRRRVLLHMPTGSGKTRTTMHIIADFLRKNAEKNIIVIWLAHNIELCNQAYNEFIKAWQQLGDIEINIYRQYGSYADSIKEIQNGMVIAGLQLLYSRSLSEQDHFLNIARRTRLTIIDEAHQATAPTYQHLLNLLLINKRSALLGLTATPGRSWLNASEDLKLAKYFYNNKVQLKIDGYKNPILYLQEKGYLAKINYINIPYSPKKKITVTDKELLELKNGFDISKKIIHTLAKDEVRNILLINSIVEEIKRKGKIIVFACSIQHAELLSDTLLLMKHAVAVITYKTPTEKRHFLIKQYKDSDNIQVLINYGILSTGFDAPRTSTAIIARPTNSVVLYSQMIGRAARGIKSGGNKKCRVITVIDQITGFRNMSEGFSYWEDVWKIKN